MKLEPTSYYVNNVVPLKDSAKEFLRLRNDEHDPTKKPPKCRSIQGGVLSDIRYSWLCRGPKLEVVHTKTGTKVAAWSFGNVLHDFETFITCVTELPSVQGKLPLLIIGLECEIGGGMICMFDINSSRVIRAIQIDDRVCVIHVVNPGCDTSFPGALRAMDGVLAVGTSSGKIVLIDLCRQICEEAIVNIGPDYVRDEINACHLTYLSFYDLNNLEIHKERSLNNGNHLALQINESSTSGVHFALHGPNGDVRLHANMEEVAISALHYCPQLGSLLIGFNFGAFQLYNLLNIRLEYTSPVYEDCIPITHFAIQEPCDDPRAFCYMWAVYNILENGDTGHPMAVMYALAYDTKDFLEGYGHLYQEFNSCSVRFQIELGAVPGFNLAPCVGARCISLNSYTKAVVKHGIIQDVPDDKLALCSIVWIAWNQNITHTETYLTLFDLNQWYKEQMPSTTRLENDALSYMSCESLSELFALATEDVNANLLDVRLDKNTLSPFVCPQRLEEHYYPMALAFQAICIQDTSIVWLGNYGAQRHLLTQLEQAGPLRLLRPNDLFHRCISLGLTPQYTDVLYSVSSPLNVQREMILSVALEHQMVRWLCHCARDWSNGSQSMAGCTLDMLLDWAWQRANTLKFQSDKLCIPLFDHLGMKLDSNALLQLNHCTCQIKHLCVLFETVVVKCKQTGLLNEQDIDDIKYQMKALEMISVYLEVLQWLLNVGLLPECPLSMYPLPDESEKISAPYPVDSLVTFYEQRRTELSTKMKTETGLIEGLNCGDLLFIDNLIDIECNGNILHKQWQCDGGNGLYPPPSLQAVLRAYLIEDIDIVHKHCLLIYLFLDLAMTLDQSHYKAIITHLIKFPAVFKLSPSVIKITQAFWQLDHGDFSTAMTQLLDPSVNNDDLKPWHHRIVLKSLLLQGQHQHALLYQQVRKPPVSNVQDICIIITLLIVNDLLQEAFHFQRYNRTEFNEKQILKHLFSICEKMNQQSAILHLPLCPVEETEFIEYLKTHPSENNNNFLVIYYLQRDRYGEAFQINDLLNSDEIFKQGLLGQHDNHFRNAIVNGFKKTLPEVTQQLLDYCKNQARNQQLLVRQTKTKTPIPMSVLIHDNATQMNYKSTLIQASFQKAKELWKPETEGSISMNNSPFVSTPKVFRFTAERNRKDCSMIYPAILETSTTVDHHPNPPDVDEEATPAKRMKLSPRRSININSSFTLNPEDNQQLNQFKKRLSSCNNSLLNTPIVKRRSIRNYNEPQQMDLDNGVDVARIGTPTSILKVRSFMKTHLKSPSPSPSTSEEENQIKIRETSITPTELLEKTQVKKRTSFGITPRKSMTRTHTPTARPAVHFEERSNSRSSNESDQQNQSQEHQIQIDVHREQTPELVIPSILPSNDSKNSSHSTDDTFYSPNSSVNQSNDSANTSLVNRSSLKRKSSDSILSRRSYKTSLTPQNNTQNTSIRDSLSSKVNESAKETNITIIITEPPQVEQIKQTESIAIEEHEQQPSEMINKTDDSPKLVARVSGRRSLSRQVLENNLFAKVVATPTPPTTPSTRMSTRLSLAKLTPTTIPDKDQKCTGIEVSYSKSTTSIVKTITEDKIEEKCAVKTTQIKDEFSSRNQTNDNQIIKHVHNESETKSNVVKITEFIDEPNESENEEQIVEIQPMQLEENETSEEEKISNQDEDENPEQVQVQVEMNMDYEDEDEELKSEESEEEIEHKQITSSNSSSASSSASSASNQDINENSTQSSSSDVILVRSSSEHSHSHSNSDKQDNNQDEIEQEQQDEYTEQSSEENVQFDDNTNEFQFHLEESIDDEPIQQQDEDNDDNGDDDDNINENEDHLMKDINEDNTNENNELFINKDIEEMEQVEIINEQQLETSRAVEMLESIAEESTELNPLETNVINISDATIHQETKISESTIHPLEQNVIEITNTTIEQPEETIASINDVSSNPLEKNVIEITDTTIIEPNETTINPLEQNVLESPELPQTPARRTRSSSQTSESKVPKTPTRSSARRRSIDQKLLEDTPEKQFATAAKRITRKRSSVIEDSPKPEEPQIITTRNRRKSTSSSIINLEVIEEDKAMSRTRRATSVDPKAEIEKPRQRRGQSLEPESTIIKRGRKRNIAQPLETADLQSIPEKIEEYSSTHRLTRHQKSIMEKSLIIQQKSRLQKLEEQDPIKLLDKESFTGSPDKEEGTYRANSPASSISTQTVDVDEANISPSTPTKRKRGRPSLNTPASAESEKKSPGRPRRRSFTQAQQSIAATTPPRTRRTSRSHEDDTASVVSVSSVASVPVVQLKQLRETDTMRHRSLSPTALQEETRKNRRRSTRTNLTKISEESQVEVEKPRRGRRKTETEDAGTSSKRRSSYKPLANYLPEHAIVKTRKTFNIRKFSRGGSSP